MIGTWFDTLDPNRRTLTIALVLIRLATLPLYGLGLLRLKAQDHTPRAVQAHTLDMGMTEAAPTEEPTPDVAPPAAAAQVSEPEPAPAPLIHQAAPPPPQVAAP